ncbi:MAG: hypothetical protein E7J35_09725 [Veillonella sp.]|jgi:hypothetical protein|uniref:hypothetical protein n=1 Tax=Veillonella TaxID=29465 RepID=UPI0029074245|nr:MULTISPECIES: hypothetical protein [Veillonella]MDU5165395.1 hypothetical protein [Veillonella parvula]MDU5558757.1 hypothetical protein [Veillonella parvula]MDU7876997.1 hypothetical protein [Veillonella sp.]MDU7928780.1 hypothetical protein [Veillonella sp.]
MLRKSLLLMTAIAAFTMNVCAVQIEVPKEQPPVPGADASIPANAYENYRHINKVAEQEVESYIQFVESKSVNPASKLDKLYRERSGFVKASELADYSQSTVVLLHEGNKNIRLSVPNVSLRGDVVESPSGKQGPLFAVRSLSAFLVVGPPHAKELNKYSESKGKYMYPGLRNTSWKFMSNNARVMYTEFTLNDTKNACGITYGGWVNTEDPYQDQAPEVVMSNYIIPSIESLAGLDSYSQIEHWGNFHYRIPKTAKLVSEAVENERHEVRTYEDTGVKIRVIRSAIMSKETDNTLIKVPIIYYLHKYNDLETPTQYAVVWNNGIPGSLVDAYKPNRESYLRHVMKDSVYYYSYRINYDESKTSYTHKQLRNMIEYVGFDDAARLRKEPQWREKGSYKERLENSPVFIPWYMEWVKLLTQ